MAEVPKEKKKKGTAAVVGLGAFGITAVKNLLEAGFEVTGFDRNDYVSGLWHWSPDESMTTVLKSTQANICKEKNCFQDFPFPDDVPTYPQGYQMGQYIEDYAAHFGLYEHLRLGHTITRIQRSADDTVWMVEHTYKGSNDVRVECFDKIVVTTGLHSVPQRPQLVGESSFQGSIIHAQEFKNPEEYAGKRVVILGLSNTGGDIAVDLSSRASKVWLSHRAGARILRRAPVGSIPPEMMTSRRTWSRSMAFAELFPTLALRRAEQGIEKQMIKENPSLREEWNLLPAPTLNNSVPMINDYIISLLNDGCVISKPAIKCVSAPNTVEFTDGTTEEVEAIILATGYQADYSFLAPEADPTTFSVPAWDNSPHANGLKYPRLYQGLFSTRYPYSLAIIGAYRGHSLASFNNADLISTAVAQVLAGNYPLPSTKEIEKWCDDNCAYNLWRMETGRIPKAALPQREQEWWLNEAAGNAINDKLGWGWEGWKFWWNDRALWDLVVNGVDSPHLYRLFEGRKAEGSRKAWPEARRQIEMLNARMNRAKISGKW